MVKKIAIGLFIVVAAILGYAATKPDTFKVERSASIKAPPEKIFPHITDLHRWDRWSPWEKKDPAMKRTFSGADQGKGAVYEWDGNSEVGKGRMEITAATAPRNVTIDLHFMEPFEGRNTAQFSLEPRGETTNVTWVMYGPSPFISKVIQVFCNMDAMIGKEFEAGLASLKALAET